MADSVIVPHVIGTVAIMMMFFVLGNYYNVYFGQLNVQAYKAQLGQVAEYFAANLNDLVAISSLVENDVVLTKEVNIPRLIGERIYRVNLTSTATGSEQVFSIVISIEALKIYAVSELMWSPDLNIEIYTNQTISDPKLTPKTSLQSDAAAFRKGQSGDPAAIVAWCSKVNGAMTLGLGVIDKIS